MQPANWHSRVFFGLHYDIHATAHDTELGAGITHEHLRTELAKVQPDLVQCDGKGHYGYASWLTKAGVASPGIVQDAVRIHREVTRELGIPLVVHYSSIWDEAAVAEHPEWARVHEDGSRDERMVCVRSEYLHDRMIPQLLELAVDYDVDGVWVDGDNWGAGACWCDRCKAAYDGQEDWLEFHRRSFMDWVRAYARAIKAAKPSMAVCSNWLYTVRQPEPIAVEEIDYLSGDFMYAYGHEKAAAEARFMDGRGIAWDLMAWGFLTAEPGATGADPFRGWTMKTLPQLQQEASVVLACGGALLVYSQPQRNGRLTPWHQDVLGDLASFCRDRKDASFGTESVPQAMVLHNPAHYYTGNSPLYNLGSAVQPLEGALYSLLENHVHTDVRNTEARLEDYALVVVPEQTQVDGKRLRDYVEQGGRLIVSGPHIAETLGELCGVEPDGTPRDQPHMYIEVDGEATTLGSPWQPVRLAGASELKPLLYGQEPSMHEANTPAVTIHDVGRGRVVAVHGPLFDHFARTRYPRARALIGELLAASGAEFDVSVEGARPNVQMSLRRRGEELFVHLVNLGSDYPLSRPNVTVDAPPPAGPVTVRLRCARPTQVRMIPGGDLDVSYSDGWASVVVPEVGVHTAVAFS